MVRFADKKENAAHRNRGENSRPPTIAS